MMQFGLVKKKITGFGVGKTKRRSLALTSLASVESLTLPHVQVIELRAEMGCTQCEKRLAHVLSKMGAAMESIVVDVLEKKVILTCRAAAPRVPMSEVAALPTYPDSSQLRCQENVGPSPSM